MNKKLKPASRLTIVFILAVLISGSILTWFSINNISNLKELTEKRVIEEQRDLAEKYSLEVQTTLNLITSRFESEITSKDVLQDSLIKTADKYEFVELPFIITDKGKFIYPSFSEITENESDSKPSLRFRSEYEKGEKSEFTNRNYTQAKKHYLSCLKYSKAGNDSVKALNALGRISVKLKKNTEAIQYYKSIIHRYYAETGNGGFPYVYYSIPQLIEIYNKENAESILPLIELCFDKISAGLIPLNYYTEELLTDVTKWSKENENQNDFQNLKNQIANISAQLLFVREYKNNLPNLVLNEKTVNQSNLSKQFRTVNSLSGNQEILLTNTNSEVIFGFVINENKLFESVLQANRETGLEFDYDVDITDEFNNSSNGNNLIYSAQLSPLVSGHQIIIKLQNEKLIDELIRRRSWIYGIATVLLIVAMFLGVFLILRDISREKRLAGLRADFISNVTHELKTPLTSINMFAESLLLKRVKSSKEKEEYLSIIIKESERLKRMINNILEFSKMEKGKSGYHLIKTNLAGLINAAIQELDYWLEQEKFEVITELDENIEAEIDSEKMKQALSNLISNSIKYSVDSKKIFIRLHKNSRGTIIEIEDEGVGMPEDKLHRIFDKFYRIDQKENISGTGLGLTVVKEIVEAHKGIIEVTSRVGKGSKFSIILNSN